MAKKSGETGEVALAPVVELVPVPAPKTAISLTLTATGQTAGFEKTQLKEKFNMTMKTAEDFVAFNQANLEALVKSGQIWAAGLQDLSQTFAATAQAQFEEAMATVKALAAVKSLKDAVDLQTSLAKASLEKVVTDTSKLTDAGMKLTEQAMAPLTARVTLAVEKFGRAA